MTDKSNKNILSESNIFNRPLKAATVLSVVCFVCLVYNVCSILLFAAEKTNTGFYIGVGFIADLLTVIYGYFGVLLLFGLGCADFYLAYSSKGCDLPRLSIALRVFACSTIFISIILSAVYTYKVILLYTGS